MAAAHGVRARECNDLLVVEALQGVQKLERETVCASKDDNLLCASPAPGI